MIVAPAGVAAAHAFPSTNDVIHPGVCVDGRSASLCPAGPVEQTFSAAATVEVRLALGGERDWDFDWTMFTVAAAAPDVPMNADDCRNGGWREFGFRNQGQCIRFVNTGKSPAAPLETESRSAGNSETGIGSVQIDQQPRSSSKPVQDSDEPQGPDTDLPQNAPAAKPDAANGSQGRRAAGPQGRRAASTETGVGLRPGPKPDSLTRSLASDRLHGADRPACRTDTWTTSVNS
jgi:hypothetical protein